MTISEEYAEIAINQASVMTGVAQQTSLLCCMSLI